MKIYKNSWLFYGLMNGCKNCNFVIKSINKELSRDSRNKLPGKLHFMLPGTTFLWADLK